MDTKQPAVKAARAEREAELAKALRRSELKSARAQLEEAARSTSEATRHDEPR